MASLQPCTAPGCTYFVTIKAAQNIAVFQVQEIAEIVVAKLLHYRDLGAYRTQPSKAFPNQGNSRAGPASPGSKSFPAHRFHPPTRPAGSPQKHSPARRRRTTLARTKPALLRKPKEVPLTRQHSGALDGRLMRDMAIRCADKTCKISALIPTWCDVSLQESQIVSARAGFRVCVPRHPG
jgi:hypothetical protein